MTQCYVHDERLYESLQLHFSKVMWHFTPLTKEAKLSDKNWLSIGLDGSVTS